MGKYKLDFSESFKNHLRVHLKNGNQNLIKKIESIYLDLQKNPIIGVGKPEKLKGNLKGMMSRRIDQKHRIIYEIFEQEKTVKIYSAMGHYDDK